LKEKRRVDQWLVDLGLADSREKAKALVMAGQVLAGTRRVDKPGENLDQSAAAGLTLKAGATLKYVSRGGLKLEKALDRFGVNPAGKLVLDIGASTGGFTDCVLQRGAKLVFAVDVGQNQLDWKIRNDPRVLALDKTNIRYLEALPGLPDDSGAAPEGEPPPLAEMVVIDVSFISLKLVLPAARRLSRPAAPIVALVKPQFEAGREQVGKGGIIKDPAVHRAVLKDLIEWCGEHHFEIRGLINSPILGTEGNREFLAYLLSGPQAGEQTITDPQLLIDEVMASAPEN
jgi:23S rRNA (cytidine1920-2'-O)/16S rRNA (cytidine1409-2'-O)-methyltransferase